MYRSLIISNVDEMLMVTTTKLKTKLGVFYIDKKNR